MASTEEVFQAASERAAAIRTAAERQAAGLCQEQRDRYPALAGALSAWLEQLCIEGV